MIPILIAIGNSLLYFKLLSFYIKTGETARVCHKINCSFPVFSRFPRRGVQAFAKRGPFAQQKPQYLEKCLYKPISVIVY
ncbi:hypothetical protein HMPREF0262_03453 [Clostridium sp. ATCC 29733]|nr:hypothetical protein HMPREF0262_03453 [Clostridium sp. ATCC 29733]